MASTLRRKLRCMLVNTIPFAVVLGLLSAVKMLEPFVVPVVTGFVVHEISQAGQLVTISGTMIKDRESCKFESVTAYSVFPAGIEKQRVPIVFLDSSGDDSSNRSKGPQKWGPWRITIPVSPKTVAIELTSLHTCHWMWGQTTLLATVPLASETH